LARLPSGQSGTHEFGALCEVLGIEHRLTRPKSPQPHGMVARFNGRLGLLLSTPGAPPSARVKKTGERPGVSLRPHHFKSVEALEKTLHRFVRLYDKGLPRSALNHGTPIQDHQTMAIYVSPDLL
jgi:transposase InsO family protein